MFSSRGTPRYFTVHPVRDGAGRPNVFFAPNLFLSQKLLFLAGETVSAQNKKKSSEISAYEIPSSQDSGQGAQKPDLSAEPGKSVPDENVGKEENWGRSVREIFESISIALVLAFLFRTFLAEMFVIPTGSMAPTLFGQHKDVICPECSAPFQVGVVQGESTDYGLCPNCNALMDFQAEAQKGNPNPNFSGDRILVGKYPYYFSSPKRWDVVVFLFPGGGNTNFIKRCVGLPGETIRIQGGDIYVKPPQTFQPVLNTERKVTSALEVQEDPELKKSYEQKTTESNGELLKRGFRIARKPPEKILATMIPVYENVFQSERLRRVKCPPRWHQINEARINSDSISYSVWKEHGDGREFYFKSEDPGEQTGWLVYQNLVLSQREWQQVELGQTPQPKPRLITDMTAYNSSLSSAYGAQFGEEGGSSAFSIPVPDDLYGRHWVKDLILECTVDVRSKKTGMFRAGLCRGGKIFWCAVNLATGDVTLEIPAIPDFGDDLKKQEEYEKINEKKEKLYFAKARSSMNDTDIYQFRFANVDDQLHVWIDGEVLKFDLPTAYLDLDPLVPTEEDLNCPVQIGCSNCEVNLSNLNLFRDLYYVARGRDNSSMSDFMADNGYGGKQVITPDFDFYSDPQRWSAFREMRAVEFFMLSSGEKQYFMLGDNSTNSADCRCWTYPNYEPRGNSYVLEDYVSESLLVGEAYYVYWPHTWKPFVPNFAKFRKIK